MKVFEYDGRWYVVAGDDPALECSTHAEALSLRDALLREAKQYEYHEGGVDYDPCSTSQTNARPLSSVPVPPHGASNPSTSP